MGWWVEIHLLNARDENTFWLEISPHIENGSPFQSLLRSPSTKEPLCCKPAMELQASHMGLSIHTQAHVTHCFDHRIFFKVAFILANDWMPFKHVLWTREHVLYPTSNWLYFYCFTFIANPQHPNISLIHIQLSKIFNTFEMIMKLNMSWKSMLTTGEYFYFAV